MTASFLLLILVTPFSLIAQPFTLTFVEQSLEQVDLGDVTLADINRDGKLDVSIVGLTRSVILAPVTEFATFGDEQEEAGAGGVVTVTANYSKPTGALNLGGVWMNSTEWTDFNGDGNLDLIMIGSTNLEEPYAPEARVVYDIGNVQFNEEVITSIVGVRSNCMSVADFNGDGEEDVLVAGVEDNGEYSTRLYLHSQQFEFVEMPTGIPGFAYCGLDSGDIDNDGDHDFVISGITNDDGYRSWVYINQGDGSFSQSSTNLTRLGYSSVSMADIDADGDLDLALAGADVSPVILEGFTEIYRNDGSGNFQKLQVDLKGTFYGDMIWSDFSNDGLPDLFISGAELPIGDRVGRIYLNLGNGEFRHLLNAGELIYSSAAAGDYDGDGDVDLFELSSFVSLQFRNDQSTINDRPSVPSNLNATVNGASALLSWSAGSDPQGSAAGLRYNLSLTRDGDPIAAPMSDLTTGARWVPNAGNMGHATSWKLDALQQGSYEWRVQSIDQSFAGSEFSAAGTFNVAAGGRIVSNEGETPKSFDQLIESYPNPFSSQLSLNLSLSDNYNDVEVSIIDILGRTRFAKSIPSSTKSFVWDGVDLAGESVEAGTFFLLVRQGDKESSKTIVKTH